MDSTTSPSTDDKFVALCTNNPINVSGYSKVCVECEFTTVTLSEYNCDASIILCPTKNVPQTNNTNGMTSSYIRSIYFPDSNNKNRYSDWSGQTTTVINTIDWTPPNNNTKTILTYDATLGHTLTYMGNSMYIIFVISGSAWNDVIKAKVHKIWLE